MAKLADQKLVVTHVTVNVDLDAALADRLTSMYNRGLLTHNDLRHLLGLPPLPVDDVTATLR